MDARAFTGRGICQGCGNEIRKGKAVINPYIDGTWDFLCFKCRDDFISKLEKQEVEDV